MHDLMKPIVGILTSRTDMLSEIIAALEKHFGKPDIIGPWQAFDHTRYYEEEMGPNLSRCFISFEELRSPSEARDYKRIGTEVEERFLTDGRRSVNVDPGYLDANKVVLVSAKGGGHKIAIAPGVYADMLLWYNKGWQAFPWAFPDFRDGSLFPLFQHMRRAFKAGVRAQEGKEKTIISNHKKN